MAEATRLSAPVAALLSFDTDDSTDEYESNSSEALQAARKALLHADNDSVKQCQHVASLAGRWVACWRSEAGPACEHLPHRRALATIFELAAELSK